jgi:copper transport protein
VRRALGVAVLLALTVPATALGHATMNEATPSVQSEVEAAPREVTVRFDQAVTATPNAIEVFAADGTTLSGVATLRDRDRMVATPVHGLQRGEAYTVRWRATSSDGHTVSGVFTFGVGVKAPPPTEAVGSSGLTWKDDLARWAVFVALSLFVGVLGARLLVLPRQVEPALERRVYLLATVGAFAAIDAGIVSFVLRGANALQLPFVDLLYGDLSPFAEETRFGNAFMVTTVGLAACAALVMLAWILDAHVLRWPAVVLGAVLASGLSLSGHQGTEPNATLVTELADWVHLVAAMLWVGGLVLLAVCVWPLQPSARRAAFLRFSRLAMVLVGVIVVAGTYLGIVRLPQLSDLWTTDYGHVLLIKIGIVCLALAWGGFHHMVVRPRLLRGDAPSGVRRSLLAESSVAMAVLLVAAILVNGSPPPVETGGTGAVATPTTGG